MQTDTFLVFDLETQRSAEEVGGWDHVAEMKVSVAVIWDSSSHRFHTYFETRIKDCLDHLLSGPRIIGYNHMGFDYTVLSGYSKDERERNELKGRLISAENLDLLVDIKKRIGKRIKLDAVARPTLKTGKSADGMMALRWYKEYLKGDQDKLQQIADYCRQDVEVTRDIYLYGLKHQVIYYEDRIEGIKSIPVNWEKPKPQPADSGPVQLSFL